MTDQQLILPDQLSCPMIIFQGTEDKIVPPSQAEIMAEG